MFNQKQIKSIQSKLNRKVLAYQIINITEPIQVALNPYENKAYGIKTNSSIYLIKSDEIVDIPQELMSKAMDLYIFDLGGMYEGISIMEINKNFEINYQYYLMI